MECTFFLFFWVEKLQNYMIAPHLSQTPTTKNRVFPYTPYLSIPSKFESLKSKIFTFCRNFFIYKCSLSMFLCILSIFLLFCLFLSKVVISLLHQTIRNINSALSDYAQYK